MEFRWAEGQYDRLSAMAGELVDQKVTLIIAGGGDRPTLAAKAATTTIPIVFTGSDDPIAFGLVTSLSRPGGNVTGVVVFQSELEVKRLTHSIMCCQLIGVWRQWWRQLSLRLLARRC